RRSPGGSSIFDSLDAAGDPTTPSAWAFFAGGVNMPSTWRITVTCDRGHTEPFALEPPRRDLAEFLAAFFERGTCGICDAACKATIEELPAASNLAYN